MSSENVRFTPESGHWLSVLVGAKGSKLTLRQPLPFAFASSLIPGMLERSESAGGLGSTIELTFLSHALVRLGGASYSILKFIILGWQ